MTMLSTRQSKSANFMLALMLVTLLSACNPRQEQTATKPETKMSWTKSATTYTKEVVYDRPKGVSQDTFSITIDDSGKVVSAMAIVPEDGGKHAEGLERFNKDLEPVIVGKSLDEIGAFDTLGGYSLTTKAFNQAIDELRAQLTPAS